MCSLLYSTSSPLLYHWQPARAPIESHSWGYRCPTLSSRAGLLPQHFALKCYTIAHLPTSSHWRHRQDRSFADRSQDHRDPLSSRADAIVHPGRSDELDIDSSQPFPLAKFSSTSTRSPRAGHPCRARAMCTNDRLVAPMLIGLTAARHPPSCTTPVRIFSSKCRRKF